MSSNSRQRKHPFKKHTKSLPMDEDPPTPTSEPDSPGSDGDGIEIEFKNDNYNVKSTDSENKEFLDNFSNSSARNTQREKKQSNNNNTMDNNVKISIENNNNMNNALELVDSSLFGDLSSNNNDNNNNNNNNNNNDNESPTPQPSDNNKSSNAPKLDMIESQRVIHETNDSNTLSPHSISTAIPKKIKAKSDPSDYSNNSMRKSTLKRNVQAWIDPYEPKVTDTFYRKKEKTTGHLDTLRPRFAKQISIRTNMDDMKSLFRDNDDDDENIQLQNRNRETVMSVEDEEEEEEETQQTVGSKKLGTWDGVAASCLLNIFGVIMFLRVGWVVGQAGIVGAILIMAISAVVTVLTTLSMSAICTNGTIAGGGAYYLISRSLGPAIGGSVGVLFSFGNMIAVSLYLIGFSETLVSHIGDPVFINEAMDIRIWSIIMLFVVMGLALGGLKYVVKVQLFLLAFILLSILCLFIGSFYQTSSTTFKKADNNDWELSYNVCKDVNEEGEKLKYLYGASGWSNGNLGDNVGSNYVETDGIKYDFFKTLAIFFPAVTGIMAGANISGDLENPSVNIPVGTLSAVSVSTVVYMLLAVFVGAVAHRCALLNNYLIMSEITVQEYLVFIGVYAATASSGIASLVGAPRILQKVAEDKVLPALSYFEKTDKDDNPIRGYFLSFGVAFCFNLVGELNLIAPLITDFFMIAYFMINFSCFALEIGHTPGWRPAFTYFNKYSALTGAILCLVIMFLMEWTYALGGCFIAFVLYYYILVKDPDVNWGSVGDSRAFYNAYRALLKLRKTRSHVKNWRPGFLILTKDPTRRPHLVLFGQSLKRSYGPIIYATIKTGDYRTNIFRFTKLHNKGYLPHHQIPKKIKGFYQAVLADSFRQGAQMLMQLVGLGNIKPNTLILGFPTTWVKDKRGFKCKEYVKILQDAMTMGYGVMICCSFRSINWLVEEYVSPSTMIDDEDGDWDEELFGQNTILDDLEDNEEKQRLEYQNKVSNHSLNMGRTISEEREAVNVQNVWSTGQGKNPIIDVWWLIDDGGLLLLVPHLLKLHNFWKNCMLRINVIVDENKFDSEFKEVENLTKRFRLKYGKPRRIPLVKSDPSKITIKHFEKLAQCKLSQVSRPDVTKRWLRVSELMVQHSRFSGLCVVTMPRPDRDEQPKAFMALLHTIARPRRMPPMIVMRGDELPLTTNLTPTNSDENYYNNRRLSYSKVSQQTIPSQYNVELTTVENTPLSIVQQRIKDDIAQKYELDTNRETSISRELLALKNEQKQEELYEHDEKYTNDSEMSMTNQTSVTNITSASSFIGGKIKHMISANSNNNNNNINNNNYVHKYTTLNILNENLTDIDCVQELNNNYSGSERIMLYSQGSYSNTNNNNNNNNNINISNRKSKSTNDWSSDNASCVTDTLRHNYYNEVEYEKLSKNRNNKLINNSGKLSMVKPKSGDTNFSSEIAVKYPNNDYNNYNYNYSNHSNTKYNNSDLGYVNERKTYEYNMNFPIHKTSNDTLNTYNSHSIITISNSNSNSNYYNPNNIIRNNGFNHTIDDYIITTPKLNNNKDKRSNSISITRKVNCKMLSPEINPESNDFPYNDPKIGKKWSITLVPNNNNYSADDDCDDDSYNSRRYNDEIEYNDLHILKQQRNKYTDDEKDEILVTQSQEGETYESRIRINPQTGSIGYSSDESTEYV